MEYPSESWFNRKYTNSVAKINVRIHVCGQKLPKRKNRSNDHRNNVKCEREMYWQCVMNTWTHDTNTHNLHMQVSMKWILLKLKNYWCHVVKTQKCIIFLYELRVLQHLKVFYFVYYIKNVIIGIGNSYIHWCIDCNWQFNH